MTSSQAPSKRHLMPQPIPHAAEFLSSSLPPASPADGREPVDTGALAIPGGWSSDRAASTVGFSVPYRGCVVSATFERFDVHLQAAAGAEPTIAGVVVADSLRADDPALVALALSAPLLDAGRHPDLVFVSTAVARAGEHIELDGRLTIKGQTLAVTALGTLRRADAPEGLRLQLHTRLDRRQFGLHWTDALGTEVRLHVDLQLMITAGL